MSKGWRWVGLSLLLVAVGAFVLRAPGDQPEQPAAVPVSAPQASAASQAASGTEKLVLAQAASAAASGALQAGRADEAIDICGVGRVTRQQVENPNLIERGQLMAKLYLLDRRKDAAKSQLSARLAAGSDREQVAARLLMDDPEGGALIAQRTTDAAAYRLALQGCGKTSEAPSCRGLTVQAWARLDPEDARPWLQLMAEAANRRDDAAAAQALEQVLQRHKRSSTRTLAPVVVGAHASVDDAVGLGLATVEVIGREAAFLDMSGPSFRYCSVEAVKEPARRARCESLALWQFKHADSVLDGMMAVAVADRVGLPAEQRPYTRQQLNDGLRRLADDALHVASLDCAGLARTADWSVKQMQGNELQQALRAVAPR